MGKKTVTYCVVDAFTDSPFKGNPAAVCLLEDERDDDWLQSIAAEFNVSQTCYLSPVTAYEPDDEVSDHESASKTPRFRLRWFTPVSEVKLCGHATLAASYFLFTSGLVTQRKIEYLTLSGILTAKRVPEAQDSFSIELDFPVVPIAEYDFYEIPSISKTLNGASIVDLKKTSTAEDLFVVVQSADDVADLQPQFDEIERCPGRGVIITGPASTGSGFDFVSRFFCPKFGIPEDPVCGSVHCALVSYWSERLGKCDLVAYAASPRGGIINLHLDEKNHRVLLRGKAVTVMRGSILVD